MPIKKGNFKAGKYYRCDNGSIVKIIRKTILGRFIASILHDNYPHTKYPLTVIRVSKYGWISTNDLCGLGYSLNHRKDECLQAEINFYKTKNHGG
jgi:hypothetical protein